MEWILNFDKNTILFMNDVIPNHHIIRNIFAFITYLGNKGFIWISIVIFLICNKKTRKDGSLLLLCLTTGTIIGNGILKNLFARPRPFIELSLKPFISEPSGYSLPSGHSVASFVAATCLFYINKKWGILAYILAFLMALSRVILIVHYPSDVIAGAIFGTLISILTILIFKKFIKQ